MEDFKFLLNWPQVTRLKNQTNNMYGIFLFFKDIS